MMSKASSDASEVRDTESGNLIAEFPAGYQAMFWLKQFRAENGDDALRHLVFGRGDTHVTSGQELLRGSSPGQEWQKPAT
jgi:hypothetical protein